MSTLLQDLRFAFRTLLRRPGFTAAAVLTLAVGLGANAAIFSVVDGVLLQPLPFPEPERLSFLTRDGDVSILDGVDWRRESRAFESIALFLRGWAFDLSGEGTPERVVGSVVEPEFFEVLRTPPLLGRTLNADDNREGGARVAVVSEGFWKRRLGSDPAVLGRKITLSDYPTEIVGVMPAHLDFLQNDVEVWVPVAVETPWALRQRGTNNFDAIGRLRPGVAFEVARAEMVALTKRLAEAYPETNTNKIVDPLPMLGYITGRVERSLLVLMGAVSLLVVLAGVNLSGLLLARSTARQSEFAVRRALGAGSGRVVRQVLTEGTLLAVLGGGLGVLLAFWSGDLLLLAAPETLPRATNVTVDVRVLGFAFFATLVVGLGMSLVPALHVLRADPATHLGSGGKGVAGTRHRALGLIVTSEVALAFLLLFGSGLLLRTFDRLQRVPLGFDPEHVLLAELILPESRYSERTTQTAAFRAIVDAVSAVPGVETASTVIGSPLQQGGGIGSSIAVFGRPPEPEGKQRGARIRPVHGDYFRAVRLPVLEGRGLTAADDEKAPLVAVVNRRFAREFFPGESALGQRIAFAGWAESGTTPVFMTIVGVASDVKAYRLDEPDSRVVYMPYVQRTTSWQRFGDLVVRAKADPAALASAVREAVLSVDKTLPLAGITTLNARWDEAAAQPRFNALALTAFAAVALFLALQGLFAILAFTVEERRREIGLRMALGATARDVLRLVVGVGLSLTAGGLVVGALLSVALGRFLGGLLYEVRPTEPAILAGAGVAFALTALFACGLPALRAARTDPMQALRED
jgi:putative ABC transport system permease protein